MTYSIRYRRRREGRTNYHKRLKLLSGGKTRLVVRRSNTSVIVQFINYNITGDVILAQATGTDARKIGCENISLKSLPASYLVGYLAGVRAKQAGVTEAIVDLGMQTSTKGNRLYAAVKGAIDAGVTVPVGEDMLPSDDRIEGKHIQSHRNITIDIPGLKAKAQSAPKPQAKTPKAKVSK